MGNMNLRKHGCNRMIGWERAPEAQQTSLNDSCDYLHMVLEVHQTSEPEGMVETNRIPLERTRTLPQTMRMDDSRSRT